MPSTCCVLGCSNHNYKDEFRKKAISFHLFPKNENMKKEWLIMVNRKDFLPTSTTRICSEHFEEDSFVYPPFSDRRFLKRTAVPTRFTHNEPGKIAKKRAFCSVGESTDSEIDCKQYAPAINSESVLLQDGSESNGNSVKKIENSVSTVGLVNPLATSLCSSNETGISTSRELPLSEAKVTSPECTYSQSLCQRISQTALSQSLVLFTDERQECDVIELVLLKIETFEKKLEKIAEMNDLYCKKLEALTQKSEEQQTTIKYLRSVIGDLKYKEFINIYSDSESKLEASDAENISDAENRGSQSALAKPVIDTFVYLSNDYSASGSDTLSAVDAESAECLSDSGGDKN